MGGNSARRLLSSIEGVIGADILAPYMYRLIAPVDLNPPAGSPETSRVVMGTGGVERHKSNSDTVRSVAEALHNTPGRAIQDI